MASMKLGQRSPDRKVQGSFFLDYVRMLKSRRDVDWKKYLLDGDLDYLHQDIVLTAWYPMEVFERMGLGILREIARDSMELVHAWGRHKADEVAQLYPEIVKPGEPAESLIHFHVVRGSYFNFDAIEIRSFYENFARLFIDYHMSDRAEEAASWQALGYFERLLELSGASTIACRFTARSWAGDENTILEIDWSTVSKDQKVKGILFLDYVRMIKNKKDADWKRWLRPSDLAMLGEKILPNQWYPMEAFERMGAAILHEVAGGDLEQVRQWGRATVDALIRSLPDLLCKGDPIETLYRFHVLRKSFFNFLAVDIHSLSGNYAKLKINYGMARANEAAASHQALGFFEQLLLAAGSKNLEPRFVTRTWEGDPTTILELKWD